MKTKSLKDYNANKFGPLLGISDEGSAAQAIMNAGLHSAKKQANQELTENEIGLIYDAERMTSAGEVPVGPEEYNAIINGSLNSLLYSTNVGVRMNARLYQPLPEFSVSEFDKNKEEWLKKLLEVFEPFLKTDERNARKLFVRLLISPDEEGSFAALEKIMNHVKLFRESGQLSSKYIHSMSILVDYDRVIDAENDKNFIKSVIDLASRLDIRVVALDGFKVEAARKRISVQGVLNVVPPEMAEELLQYSKLKEVLLRYRYAVDVQTAARTIWTGLFTAKSHNLDGAKYGLVPLSLEDQERIMTEIQGWLGDWSAIPAFYVDTPLLTDQGLFLSDDCAEALKKWLKSVKKSKGTTVLVDCPDRINPRIDVAGKESARRTIKLDPNDPDDRGVLTYGDISDIINFSKDLGINILWSGGIRPANAYELGKIGAFGIFTTSSTSVRIPVGDVLKDDWQMAMEVEPTSEGIQKVHSLLQAGFLVGASANSDQKLINELKSKSEILIGKDRPFDKELNDLKEVLIKAWKSHWNN